jgi:hypothetical protein
MAENGITWEERENLYKKSAVAFIVVFAVIMVYFVHLMQTDRLRTFWEFYIQVLLPMVIGATTAWFLTFEVLYYGKVKRGARFHIKRFANNVLVTLGGLSTAFLFQSISLAVVSGILGELRAFLLGTALWLVFFFIVVTKFRNRQLRKILE